ncbi:hypothetical protein AB0M38_21270 [Streptomyces sp. NPDC051742]|uniref:hypothetical protein n=1 Tax=unclassified Streptomyces TaxID=2593676 RepID=UPI00343DED12
MDGRPGRAAPLSRPHPPFPPTRRPASASSPGHPLPARRRSGAGPTTGDAVPFAKHIDAIMSYVDTMNVSLDTLRPDRYRAIRGAGTAVRTCRGRAPGQVRFVARRARHW